MTIPRCPRITAAKGTSSSSLRLCLFGIIVLSVGLSLPEVAAAREKGHDDCGKDEVKTDQGCRKHPQVVKRTSAEYPPEARSRRVEGSVTLQGRITEQGTVEDIKVVKSEATEAGFAQSFRESAVAAFRQWRYRPATIEGKPVATEWTVVIDFKLGGW